MQTLKTRKMDPDIRCFQVLVRKKIINKAVLGLTLWMCEEMSSFLITTSSRSLSGRLALQKLRGSISTWPSFFSRV